MEDELLRMAYLVVLSRARLCHEYHTVFAEFSLLSFSLLSWSIIIHRLYETTLSTTTADTTTSITSNNIINNTTIMTTPTVVTNALLHRAIGKLRPETTAMLLCDVQERFRPLLYHGETVIQTCRYLTSVAHELQMPVIATQQYTKVFGPTVAECFANEDIQKAATPVFDKKKFSMLTPEVMEHLQTTELWKDRTSFVLFGIETHVCVQQTALDLLEVRTIGMCVQLTQPTMAGSLFLIVSLSL